MSRQDRYKGSKYTSNKTHYSPTDSDARTRVKPGTALNNHEFAVTLKHKLLK